MLQSDAHVFLILNINCTYVYTFFCENKKNNYLCRGRPALRAEAMTQAWHDAHAELTQTLLNVGMKTNRNYIVPSRIPV
jgi:hypothetical protein